MDAAVEEHLFTALEPESRRMIHCPRHCPRSETLFEVRDIVRDTEPGAAGADPAIMRPPERCGAVRVETGAMTEVQVQRYEAFE